MRINHVIKTDQWRAAPEIRPAPHLVVSRKIILIDWLIDWLIVVVVVAELDQLLLKYISIQNTNYIFKK